MLYLGVAVPIVPFPKMVLLVTIQAALFFGIVCWLSYWLVPKTDLSPLASAQPLKRMILPGVLAGLLVGGGICLLNGILFGSSLLLDVHQPAWMGLLASLYGGINEEVLLRLFLFTLVYFLFGKLFKVAAHHRMRVLWTVNVLVALVFAAGHLPVLLKLVAPSSLEMFRVLLLNGIPGVVFGWLYWSRGLWAAMMAHFVADVVIHVA